MRLDRWEGTSSNVHKGLEKVTDGSVAAVQIWQVSHSQPLF